MQYEIHITLEDANDGRLEDYAYVYSLHTSAIVGWDELGSGKHQFLTYHRDGRLDNVYNELMGHIDRLREERWGFTVIRGKIEKCLFDWRPEGIALVANESGGMLTNADMLE